MVERGRKIQRRKKNAGKFMGFTHAATLIWYIFVNNGAPVQWHKKLCKNNSCDRTKVGYRDITVAN